MADPVASDLTLAGLVHDLNNVFQTIGEAAERIRVIDRAARGTPRLAEIVAVCHQLASVSVARQSAGSSLACSAMASMS